MATILIIEDDKEINEMLTDLLRLESYDTVGAYSGTEGILLCDDTIDLVLLDLMLPGKTGSEVIQELKAKWQVPVMIMTAISEMETKLDLFHLGAEDYITKPFDPQELLARIHVHLKQNQKSMISELLKYEQIEMNVQNHEVVCHGKKINLSKIEFELLKVFMMNPKQVFTKSHLFQLVWDGENSADDNTLNVHISKIRNKLKEVDPNNDYIETVWSIGYKLR